MALGPQMKGKAEKRKMKQLIYIAILGLFLLLGTLVLIQVTFHAANYPPVFVALMIFSATARNRIMLRDDSWLVGFNFNMVLENVVSWGLLHYCNCGCMRALSTFC